MAKPHQLVVTLFTRMFAEELRVSEVMARANVGRATWHRIAHGGLPKLETVDRIMHAIDEMVAEREGADAA